MFVIMKYDKRRKFLSASGTHRHFITRLKNARKFQTYHEAERECQIGECAIRMNEVYRDL